MRYVKVEIHHPDDVEHANGRDRVQFAPAEDAVQTCRYQNGRVRVESVIEELSQRPRQPDATRLFAVDPIQRVRGEDEDGRQQPHDVRDGRDVRMVVGAGRKVPVVPRQHDEIQRREQETDKRHDVWGQPAREEVDQVVPERMHHVDAERRGVAGIVL